MNLEKIEDILNSIEEEYKSLKKTVIVREILEYGCVCGNDILEQRFTERAAYGGIKAKRVFVCKECGEKWKEYYEDQFTDKKETVNLRYKSFLFRTKAELKYIKEDMEKLEEKK